MEISSGHERPFARLGQAELARILLSQLQTSPGSRLRVEMFKSSRPRVTMLDLGLHSA